MKRSTKRLLFLFISLAVMTLSGLAGYILAQREPRIVEAEQTEDIAADADNTRLSANALVTWVYEYEMCRHKITEMRTAGDDLAGLSFAGLRQRHPKARITAFGPDDATLEMSFACYCPDHYILKKDDGGLGLYHTLAGTDSQEKIREYPIDMDSLTSEESDELAVGRMFTDREGAAAYVEKLRTRKAFGIDE